MPPFAALLSQQCPATNWRSPMRRLFLWAGVAISALGLAGCATMDVGSHVARGLDVGRFRTYEWGRPDALPLGDPRLETSSFYRDHVVGAIDTQLAGRGFARSGAGTPDLLVHYHA